MVLLHSIVTSLCFQVSVSLFCVKYLILIFMSGEKSYGSNSINSTYNAVSIILTKGKISIPNFKWFHRVMFRDVD